MIRPLGIFRHGFWRYGGASIAPEPRDPPKMAAFFLMSRLHHRKRGTLKRRPLEMPTWRMPNRQDRVIGLLQPSGAVLRYAAWTAFAKLTARFAPASCSLALDSEPIPVDPRQATKVGLLKGGSLGYQLYRELESRGIVKSHFRLRFETFFQV